jgi:hypothetical protein
MFFEGNYFFSKVEEYQFRKHHCVNNPQHKNNPVKSLTWAVVIHLESKGDSK